MPKRYFVKRPLMDDEEWEARAVQSLARIVHEPDPTPYPTGLLDASGEPLWACLELDQIGFVRHD